MACLQSRGGLDEACVHYGYFRSLFNTVLNKSLLSRVCRPKQSELSTEPPKLVEPVISEVKAFRS